MGKNSPRVLELASGNALTSNTLRIAKYISFVNFSLIDCAGADTGYVEKAVIRFLVAKRCAAV